MSANQKSSVTTSGLGVNDTNRSANMSEGAGSKYAGTGTMSGVAANQNSQLRPVTVKQTDHRALAGSNAPNDFRVSGDSAAAAMAQIANPPGPREQMRGQRTQRSYTENGKAFVSSPSDSDAGN